MIKKYFLILLTIVFIAGCTSVAVTPDEVITNPDVYEFKIARGDLEGFERVLMSGFDADVTSTENLISNINSFTFPTYESVLNVSSSSANDNSLGTGARTLLIEGVDINYNKVSEIIILNGLSNVQTFNSYYRLNRVIVLSSGSSGENQGDIILNHPETTIAKIEIGEGQESFATYSVPNDHTLFLNTISASAGKNEQVDFKFWLRVNNISILSSRIVIYQTSDDYESFIPSPIPEKSDIYITGSKIGASGDATASLIAQFTLVNNSALESYPHNQ